MKLILKIGFACLLSVAFFACGDDDEYDPIDQQNKFQDFLDAREITYDAELAKKYLFRVNLPDSLHIVSTGAESEGEIIQSGDEIEIYYIGYLFNSSAQDGGFGRGGVFSTNIKEVAIAIGLDIPEINNYRPLPVTVGDGRLMKGLNEGIPGSRFGDVILLYLSADYAYGDWGQVGTVEHKEPVVYEIYIMEKQVINEENI